MTTGEFDFGDTFFNSTLPYPVTTFALWVIFIIVMPVLFNNLLVRSYSVYGSIIILYYAKLD